MSLDAKTEPADVDQIVAAVRALQTEVDRLPAERNLAERLNVKRHQLRKALAILRQSGDLVPASARRAPTALPRYSEELVRLTNPIEVLEMRLLMEPGLARLASLRASALDMARISRAATTPEDAAAGPVDLAFHLAIVEAARNHLAGEFYKMLRQVGVDARVRIARITPVTCPKRIRQRDAEHRLIAEAIADRDPEAAETAMRAHLLSVQKQIHARINAGTEAA
ncbi:MAG: FadR family transcriptional regulator [Bauldia sp.]|nr:FadR family transcriptional regulator [Bauldia sp.]